jgi:hypothetical protein
MEADEYCVCGESLEGQAVIYGPYGKQCTDCYFYYSTMNADDDYPEN